MALARTQVNHWLPMSEETSSMNYISAEWTFLFNLHGLEPMGCSFPYLFLSFLATPSAVHSTPLSIDTRLNSLVPCFSSDANLSAGVFLKHSSFILSKGQHVNCEIFLCPLKCSPVSETLPPALRRVAHWVNPSQGMDRQKPWISQCPPHSLRKGQMRQHCWPWYWAIVPPFLS